MTPTQRGSGDPPRPVRLSLSSCVSADGPRACLQLGAHTPSPIPLRVLPSWARSETAGRSPWPPVVALTSAAWTRPRASECLCDRSRRDAGLRAAFPSHGGRGLSVPPSCCHLLASPPGESNRRCPSALAVTQLHNWPVRPALPSTRSTPSKCTNQPALVCHLCAEKPLPSRPRGWDLLKTEGLLSMVDRPQGGVEDVILLQGEGEAGTDVPLAEARPPGA